MGGGGSSGRLKKVVLPPPPPPCSTYELPGHLRGDADALKSYDYRGARRECRPHLDRHISKLREDFCKIPGNITKDPGPGGRSCLTRDQSGKEANSFCEQGSNIARTDMGKVCSRDALDANYDRIAEKYCQTPDGRYDNFCSCYNVTNGVCDADASSAGCGTKAAVFDPLVEATPVEFRGAWMGREACFGGVCTGTAYVPNNANQNCNTPIKICNQQISASNMDSTEINATCNLGDGPVGDGGGPAQPKKREYEPGTLSYRLDKFRSKLPKGLQQLIPVSTEEVTEEGSKLATTSFTFTSSISSSLSIIIIIIVLAMNTKKASRVYRG
jgi:hypothetical protein